MDYVALLKSGSDKWALERASNPAFRPILRDVNFVAEFGGPDFYDLPDYTGVDFSNSDMNMASLRNCMFFDCSFDDPDECFGIHNDIPEQTLEAPNPFKMAMLQTSEIEVVPELAATLKSPQGV